MSKMNILWITTDQQQWRTIANRSLCRMPNVQRLIDSGMLFNRAYAPMPVCCPVRAMWISGAYPWHNGVYTQVHSAPSLTVDMHRDVVTYSQRLKEAGYCLGFVGKWHAGHRLTPVDFGFDEIAMPLAYGPGTLERLGISRPKYGKFSVENPYIQYIPVRQFSWPGSKPFNMWGYYKGPIEELDTTRVANAAIDMINRFTKDKKPWHIAVHFQEPHDPYDPHEEYLKRYDPNMMPVPESFYDTFAGKPGMHRRESQTWGDVTEDDVRQSTAHYFAYCEQIDDQIGRILDALERSGQMDNTMIFFTSDHGDMLGAHRMWIKSWMPYEEVYLMPLVIKVPGMKKGVCDHLVQTHDIPHTFLELVDAQPLPYPDGRSLKPLLENPDTQEWDDAVLCAGYGCEFFVTQRILITTRWKYVFNGFDFDEMYDLEKDPAEMHNIIDDSLYITVRSQLRAKLYELMNKLGDPYGDVGPGGENGAKPNRYEAPRYLPRS